MNQQTMNSRASESDAAKQPRAVAIVCNPLYAVGAVAMAAGILLWLGNLSGLLQTFRGAGLLAIVLGAILWHLGIWFPRRREL
jgi:hypothetical protein